jgi:hypothetical protein
VSNEELTIYQGIKAWSRLEHKRASAFMSRERLKAQNCKAQDVGLVASCLRLAFINGQEWFSRDVPEACSDDGEVSALVGQYVKAIEDAARESTPPFSTQPNPLLQPEDG